MHNGFIIQIKTVDLKGRIFEFLSKTFPKTIFNQVFLMFHLLSAVKNIMHLSIILINNVRLMKYNIFLLLKVCCVYLTEKQVHTIHTVSQEYIYIYILCPFQPTSTYIVLRSIKLQDKKTFCSYFCRNRCIQSFVRGQATLSLYVFFYPKVNMLSKICV